MLGTGSIMRWFEPFPDYIRTGATFVHDWTFVTLFVVIVGHIMFAFGDPDSLRSMVRGWVPEQWARRERPRWWAEELSARAGGDVETSLDEGLGEASVGTSEM